MLHYKSNRCFLKEDIMLKIGNIEIKVPIFQGGMVYSCQTYVTNILKKILLR